jgi:DNA polymerase III subunit epsilon
MKSTGDKPGFYRGKDATEYVEQVLMLKRAKQFAQAERLLLALIQAVEVENRVECWGVAPWYCEQLANIYHGQKNYAAEIAVLERYERQPYRKRVFPFANRLIKARELLRERRS